LRELHWHPNGSEWQFWIQGQGRMTVFAPAGRARTMDFHANDVGFVPNMAGHAIENTGDTDLIFLEIISAPRFVDFSLNNWLRHLPPEMVAAHLNLDASRIRSIPDQKELILGE
jgi:oxalate decarboxylase